MTDHSVDINTIPYYAPLSVEEPSLSWKLGQNTKGGDNAYLYVQDKDLTGKWIIITGSNNGIGREAAIRLASWGANLILGCRDPPAHEISPAVVVEECREAAKKAGHGKSEIEWWKYDCADLSSVERFAKQWLDTGRPLDVLANNAGMGSSPGGNKVFKTKDGFEIVHQVNFLAHALLTLYLLPALAKAPEPRVVCTTSCFHFLGKYNVDVWNGEDGVTGAEGVQFYQNNKMYYQIWLTEMQRRLLQHDQYKHITINGVHPGYVRTGIWVMNKRDFMAPVKEAVVKSLAWLLGVDAQQGSLCILNAITNPDLGPDPRIQGVGHFVGRGGGRYISRLTEEEPMPHTRNADCRQRVWRKANEELKLKERGLLDVLGVDYVK